MDSWHMADWHGFCSPPLFAYNDCSFHCERGTGSIRTRTLTHQTIFKRSPATTKPHSLGWLRDPRKLYRQVVLYYYS